MSLIDLLDEILNEIGIGENKVKPGKVCKALGVSRMTLNKWKRGITEPSLYNMQQLIDFFGIELEINNDSKIN